MAYIFKTTTSAPTVSSAPYDDVDWSNIGNIYASDSSYGTVTLAAEEMLYSYRCNAKGMDFSSIPTTATITGAYCQAELHRSGGTADIVLMQLLDTSGNPTGTNQYAAPAAISDTVPDYISVGGDGSMWGCALTVSWVKNANFGVAFAVRGSDSIESIVYCDYIGLGIYYTVPSGGGAKAILWSFSRPTIVGGG